MREVRHIIRVSTYLQEAVRHKYDYSTAIGLALGSTACVFALLYCMSSIAILFNIKPGFGLVAHVWSAGFARLQPQTLKVPDLKYIWGVRRAKV